MTFPSSIQGAHQSATRPLDQGIEKLKGLFGRGGRTGRFGRFGPMGVHEDIYVRHLHGSAAIFRFVIGQKQSGSPIQVDGGIDKPSPNCV
jgi:hypothetical protein